MSFKAYEQEASNQKSLVSLDPKTLYHATFYESLGAIMSEGILAAHSYINQSALYFRHPCTPLFASKKEAILYALSICARNHMTRADIAIIGVDATDIPKVSIMPGSSLRQVLEGGGVSQQFEPLSSFNTDYFKTLGRIALYGKIEAKRLSFIESGCYHVPKADRIRAYWKKSKDVNLVRLGRVNDALYQKEINPLAGMTFWHCTPKCKISSILETGLLPSFSDNKDHKVVFLSSTIHLASYFGHAQVSVGRNASSKDLVMIKIPGDSLDSEFITLDEMMAGSHHGEKIMRLPKSHVSRLSMHLLDKTKSIAYKAVIPVDASQVYDYGSYSLSIKDMVKELRAMSQHKLRNMKVLNPQRKALMDQFEKRMRESALAS